MALKFDARLVAIGLNRFGLGPKAGDLAKAANDPLGFLREEIARRSVVQPDHPELLSTPLALAALREQREARREARANQAAEKSAQGDAKPDSMAATGAQPSAAEQEPRREASAAQPAQAPPEPPVPQRLYRAEIAARIDAAISAEAGYVERLVWFWSNHFAVSVSKGAPVRATAGAFEREAIRPHVLGRFADMLLAVERHPTMLFYLDNQLSIGPQSAAGKRRGRGLNENLAREILELHTLGVDGGYSQDDVTSLAKVITGWTIAGVQGQLGEPGTFVFNANWHEPGDRVMLGRSYRDAGVEQGEAVLGDIARHPATARHIATKLARHFVADVPPAELVARLTRVFLETDGDLAALSLALLEAPEAWSPQPEKLRSPQEFLVATLRLFGKAPEAPAIVGALTAMGQGPWNPPGPNGFPDTVAHWASPEGMRTRLEFAAQVGRRAAAADPAMLLDAGLGALASSETRQAVTRAESRQQAIALLIMAPEFQRR